jgi:Asp-tRNA(Asn)/Glu-tRNA(Gln) amidotransferase A subunit family amidase
VSHPQDLPLREQARLIASGDLDAGELLDATLARIEERNPALNAIVATFAEHTRGMLGAAPPGPLHGVPLTIKDMFALPWRGYRNATSRELGPATASGPFRRLRDAGAVIVGVDNMHELGLGTTGRASVYGPARNPWNPEHCTGGSSSGSAAGVAAPSSGSWCHERTVARPPGCQVSAVSASTISRVASPAIRGAVSFQSAFAVHVLISPLTAPASATAVRW